jgi:hypothetical protein
MQLTCYGNNEKSDFKSMPRIERAKDAELNVSVGGGIMVPSRKTICAVLTNNGRDI